GGTHYVMRRSILTLAALGLAGAPAAGALAQPYDPYGPVDDHGPVDPYGPVDDYGPVDPYDPAYDEPYAEPYHEDLHVDDSYIEPASAGSVSLDLFRQELSPHGQWVQTPEYGLVWIPSSSVVGHDFVPYASGGTWRHSDVG